MSRRTRRTWLATLGALASGCVAGCQTGRSGDATETDPGTDDGQSPTATQSTPTERPTDDGDGGTGRVAMGEPVDIDGAAVTLASPRVRRCILHRGRDGRSPSRVLGVHDGQYVVVDVTVDGTLSGDASAETLAPVLNGQRRDGRDVLVEERDDDGRVEWEPALWAGQPVAVPFPARTPESASIRWWREQSEGPAAAWELDASVRETLGRAPRFTLLDFDATWVADGVRLDVRVRNTGARDGRFRARARPGPGIQDASAPIDMLVPAGDTARYRDVPPLFQDEETRVFPLEFIETVDLQYPEDGQVASVDGNLGPIPTPTE